MKSDNPYYEATRPFDCQGSKQFIAVEDGHQTLRRRMAESGVILDEIVVTSHGCAIEEIVASPSGKWAVTRRNSGQGEFGYDVLRTVPLCREAGIDEERGIMIDIPKFSDDETQLVGGFGQRWIGGWWAHEDDDFESPARGGVIFFGFLLVHHLPSHQLDRHELKIDLPKGWLPENQWDEIWHGAREITSTAESISMQVYGGVEVKIEGPLPPTIMLPTPHPSGRRLF